MNERAEGAFRLLFVCTGNTCRSPMAEAIARARIGDLGWEIEVLSAGVAAFDGSPASGGAVRACEEHGLDLGAHRSTYLTEELTAGADLILTMSPTHLLRVVELGGGDRAALLTAYARGEEGPTGASIPDPIGGDDAEYLETFRTLNDLVERALERLQPVVAR